VARRKKRDAEPLGGGVFLREVEVERPEGAAAKRYPFSIPALRKLERLDLDAPVTFFVGENGSGKSTLLEAIAVAAGFNPEGGDRHLGFSTRRSESPLHEHLRLSWGKRPRDGFFFRGESFFNVATAAEEVGAEGYGPTRLHEMSHGESFLALVNHRFMGRGLYVLDEPESALSPSRLLSLLAAMRQLVLQGSQFVIATHSPILLAYPGAGIWRFEPDGLHETPWAETEHVSITRMFLQDPQRFLKHLFADEPEEDEA
jgi:predicted ATPase